MIMRTYIIMGIIISFFISAYYILDYHRTHQTIEMIYRSDSPTIEQKIIEFPEPITEKNTSAAKTIPSLCTYTPITHSMNDTLNCETSVPSTAEKDLLCNNTNCIAIENTTTTTQSIAQAPLSPIKNNEYDNNADVIIATLPNNNQQQKMMADVPIIPTTTPIPLNRLTIKNNITQEMLSYKHWSRKKPYTPSTFELTINGTIITPEQEITIENTNEPLYIGYRYIFMNGVRTGEREIPVTLQTTTKTVNITFSWHDPNHVILNEQE